MKQHRHKSIEQIRSATLLIQAIHVEWGRLSRGAPQAVARNGIPEAVSFPIPAAPIKDPHYHIHHLFYSEANKFQQPHFETVETKAKNKHLNYDCVRRRPWALVVIMPHTTVKILEPGDETVRYDRVGISWLTNTNGLNVTYMHTSGVPRTPPASFTLESGQWMRIRYNARYSVQAGWVYDKWAFNIGTFDNPSPDVFLSTRPSYIHSQMSKLW